MNKTNSPAPLFSVIIPNHNGEKTLPEVLEAILAPGYSSLEVIVVDDASTDNSRKLIRDYPMKLISHEECRGAAAARNSGAAAAAGKILVFIDNDVVVPADTFNRLDSRFRDPGLSAVIGLLAPLTRYGNLCSQYKNFYMHYTYLKLPERVTVFYTSIAAIRRDVFEASGGFDTRYRSATIEDMEFGVRLTGKGYRISIDKSLQVDHLRHYTLFSFLRTGFLRAAGLAKIALRDRLSRREKKSYVTTSPAFLAGIVLAHLSFFFLVFFLLFSGWLWAALTGLSWLAIVLCNAGFLTGLARRTHTRFFFSGGILLILDCFVHGLGVIGGVYSFLRGRKY